VLTYKLLIIVIVAPKRC